MNADTIAAENAAESAREEIIQLRQQKAELLATLKTALECYSTMTTHQFGLGADKFMRLKMEAAIALAERR